MEYGEEPRSVADKGAGLKAKRNQQEGEPVVVVIASGRRGCQ